MCDKWIFLDKISPVEHNIAFKILLLIYSYKTDGNNISLVRFHLYSINLTLSYFIIDKLCQVGHHHYILVQWAPTD